MYVRCFLFGAGLLVCAFGCSDSTSDGGDGGDGGNESSAYHWICFEGATSCWCPELGPGDLADSSEPEVLACRSFSCCLYAAGAPRGSRDCECEDLATDCQAEANSRPGTTFVPTCPPGEIDMSRCAGSGVNCRDDFLQERNLLGCCPGLTCQMNAEGVPVCL